MNAHNVIHNRTTPGYDGPNEGPAASGRMPVCAFMNERATS